MDLNRGLPADELDKLIGKRDYRLFLNSRNEMYRDDGHERESAGAPRGVGADVEASQSDQAADPGEGRRIVLGYDEEALGEMV